MGGMFNYKTHATRQERSGAGVDGRTRVGANEGPRGQSKHQGFAWNELRQGGGQTCLTQGEAGVVSGSRELGTGLFGVTSSCSARPTQLRHLKRGLKASATWRRKGEGAKGGEGEARQQQALNYAKDLRAERIARFFFLLLGPRPLSILCPSHCINFGAGRLSERPEHPKRK